jgi:hypothetical protein
MLESSNLIGAGLATIGMSGTFLDIISKKNIEGCFAFLESYNLDIVLALLIISLIFMMEDVAIRNLEEGSYLNPNSDMRILLANNPERYTLSRIILWQIIQNYYARQQGCPEYSLKDFETTSPGYLSPLGYNFLGSTILPNSLFTRSRYFLALNATDILDVYRYTKFPDGYAVINDDKSSRLAHASSPILRAVVEYETRKWNMTMGK